MEYQLSPAETAKRFGISIKALRLYEGHGLLTPLRTSNGTTRAAWRVYGFDQITRLHQILALKRLGLSLAQIGELLVGEDALDSILAFQERVLAKDSKRIARALVLIRKARTKLASGEALSIDDLATLSLETVMTSHTTAGKLEEVLAPFKQGHLTPDDEASLQGWFSGQTDVKNTAKELMEEAGALMRSGDASSVAAINLARRFRALRQQVMASGTSPVPTLEPKLKAMVSDAQADPQASQKMEVLVFIQKAIASLKAQEGNAEEKG